MEPPIRLELMTVGLQNRCSTNWAMVARVRDCIKNVWSVKIFFNFSSCIPELSGYTRNDFRSLHIIFMITLLAITDGYKHFDIPIQEYMKRLGKNMVLKTLKPISHTNIEYIKVKETLSILEWLRKSSGTIILLDERGKWLNTREFVEMIEHGRDTGEKIIFIIGGSYGVDLELLQELKPRLLRVSDFVMPHSLALLVIIEQIYRAHEIIKGSGYHHS